VPYTYVLHSGKTVIQHIYDSHYDGADRARDFVSQWNALAGPHGLRALPRYFGAAAMPGRRSRGVAQHHLPLDLSALGAFQTLKAELCLSRPEGSNFLGAPTCAF